MKKVLVLKNWDSPNLLRQTHLSKGIWEDFQFFIDPSENELNGFDYAIVLNFPGQKYTITGNPNHIWAIMQEPPNEYFGGLHKRQTNFSRIYSTNLNLNGKKYHHDQPALPWHINRDYDQLKICAIPKKEKKLSWITSNISAFKGHKDRISFLSKINGAIDFDLYGRGYHFIDDKWDGLAPYRYTLVVENFCNSLYWSEKLADSFLTWTYPIYFGCTKINDFFPKEALLQIDINDEYAIEQINDAINSNLWKKNLDALIYSRELILEKYQFFPFIVNEIKLFEQTTVERQKNKQVILNNEYKLETHIQEKILLNVKRHFINLRMKVVKLLKKILIWRK